MDDELAEFLEPGLDLEMSRERDPLVLRLETEEGLADPQRVDRVARSISSSRAPRNARSSRPRRAISSGLHSQPGSIPGKER